MASSGPCARPWNRSLRKEVSTNHLSGKVRRRFMDSVWDHWRGLCSQVGTFIFLKGNYERMTVSSSASAILFGHSRILDVL